MQFLVNLKNAIHRWILESGKHFRDVRHLWVAYRGAGIKCEYPRFGRAQARARINCANSAISALLSLKQCQMKCGNVPTGRISKPRRPNHSRVCSDCSIVALNTFNRFVTLCRGIILHPALELNHLSQRQIWYEPCLLHEQWHGNSNWRLRLWFTLNLSRFCHEMLILFPSSSCDSRSQVQLRRSPHLRINSCASF